MKLSLPFLLVACAAFCLPLPGRALDPAIFDDDAPLTPALAQLFTDLEAIPAGATVSDLQHQTLLADLLALPPGPDVPTADDLDLLATELGSVATGGLVNDDLEYDLAGDFDVDPTDPDSWLAYVSEDVLDALNPLTTTGPVSTLPIGTFEPVYVLANAASGVVSGVTTTVPVMLTQAGPADFSVVYYSGQAKLITHSPVGQATVQKFVLSTVGLSPRTSYLISVTRRSTGASLEIGKLRRSDQSEFSKGTVPGGGTPPTVGLLGFGKAVFGGEQPKRALPPGFDAADVATIQVADKQGDVLLAGTVDTSATADVTRTVTLRLQGGSATPKAHANATVRRTVQAAVVTDRFRLAARHLPAHAAVTLVVDGKAVGQFTVTNHGRLVIVQGVTTGGHPVAQSLPAGVDLSNVKALALTDAQGNVLVSGGL